MTKNISSTSTADENRRFMFEDSIIVDRKFEFGNLRSLKANRVYQQDFITYKNEEFVLLFIEWKRSIVSLHVIRKSCFDIKFKNEASYRYRTGR